jgi:hypothetical protein
LSFTPTAIAGHATVLFGSNDGVIYGVALVISGDAAIVDSCGCSFPRWCPFALPIEAIVHDQSSGCVSALYGRSELRFFEFSEGVMRAFSKFENRTMCFLNIEAIPISDSAVVRFIAFAENGGRLAFGRRMQRGPIECMSQLEEVVSDSLLAGAHHCLCEVVIHLHYEFDRRIILLKREFVSRTPPENTKEGRIKDLAELSCMWCKSYDRTLISVRIRITSLLA